MFKELFLRRFPSQLEINSVIKAYIIAETLIWSAANFITPIFGIFVLTLRGGTVDVAASAYSTYLVTRVIFELISGKFLLQRKTYYKYILTILGISIISLSYIGLSFSQLIVQIYIFYGMIGIGIGLATPAKNSLFSSNLTPDKDSSQWSALDASVFLSMALSAVIGGFVARIYGFELLFLIAAVVNFLGIFPYIIFFKKWGQLTERKLI